MHDSNAPDASLPEHIGPYRVERRLGRGGMGEVFLAWDDRLERRVAVKRIRHDAELSPQQRERFRREARAAARLSHPAVVRVHHLVSEGDEDAIVLEYVEGASLAERLASGPLPPADAVSLARQIAEGLVAAHDAGLIHRDLKAENVLVTPSGQAKILDFGLVRPLLQETGEADLTQYGALLGTYHAMSPEQASGGAVDPRSDLFSFGALLYEMLTGSAPFRGANALDTLKRVLTETPPPLAEACPDLPARLTDLVDRLLAKDRQGRPRDAREVALVLARIEIRAQGMGQAMGVTDSVSDMSTGPLPVASPAAMPAARAASASSFSRRRAPPWLRLTGILLAIALAGGLSVLLARRAPLRPLRVAIARPEIVPAAGDPGLGLAASGVLSSTLAALSALQGLAPIDPWETDRGGGSPVETARIAAADEVLAARIERESGALGRISLRRIQGRDGRVLWTATFKVPTDPDDLRLLADAVSIHLRRAYPDHAVRPGTPELAVRDGDYAAFLQVKQRIDAGAAVLAPERARLEEIARSSPRFLEAQILGARVSLSLFRSTRSAADLDRATALLRQAKALAPNDPRPLGPDFQIALYANREKEAAAILARMEQLQPGDPEVLLQRSRLAERQGRWEEALQDLRTAAERAPSWKSFFWLARLEGRLGDLAAAREHCAAVLRQAPGNPWAREELAQLEMEHGDLQRAERLFADLAHSSPRRNLFTNLGGVLFLRGRYTEAAEAFRRALAIDPRHTGTLTNLAETEVELGQEPAARELYGRALELLLEREKTLGVSPETGMSRAVCLARLGRGREAASLVQEVLRRSPDDPNLLYGAAFVYSVVGDRNSALGNAEAALAKGKGARWFTGSAFRPLLNDPELRSLLTAGHLPSSAAALPGARTPAPEAR